MVVELSQTDARRIAVRAQLLDAHRPDTLLDVVRQLTFVQLEPTAPIAPRCDNMPHRRLPQACLHSLLWRMTRPRR